MLLLGAAARTAPQQEGFAGLAAAQQLAEASATSADQVPQRGSAKEKAAAKADLSDPPVKFPVCTVTLEMAFDRISL